MLLSDKIIQERKKKGWSQEELANQLDISRQSVSKWESNQSIPDVERIIQLANLFNVSTDYLLKDHLENNPTIEEVDDTRMITLTTASEYIETVKKNVSTLALGISLCILSPCMLLGLVGLVEGKQIHLSEDFAAMIGVVCILLFVMAGVALIMLANNHLKQYEYLNYETIQPTFETQKVIGEEFAQYLGKYRINQIIGVMLCIASPIPLLASSIFEEAEYLAIIMIPVLLVIVSIAVYLFVTGGNLKAAYQKILQLGEYIPEYKETAKQDHLIKEIYWGCIVVIYLIWSFKANAWANSWIIFVIGGVFEKGLYLLIHKTIK